MSIENTLAQLAIIIAELRSENVALANSLQDARTALAAAQETDESSDTAASDPAKGEAAQAAPSDSEEPEPERRPARRKR